MSNLKLDSFVKDSVELPMSAQILPKLMAALKDPNSSIDDVIKLLKLDISLSAQILRMASSSYYGTFAYSGGLESAIQRIGLSEVNRLVAIAASRGILDQPMKGYKIKEGELAKDSLATAQVMTALCKQGNRKKSDVYFTTGLLHGIGKVVIDQYLKARGLSLYGQHEMSMDSEPMVTPEMERVILGFDHAQAGAALLENWKFPQVMTETIARQFEPSMDDPDPRMSYCLDFANDFGPSFRESEESANDFPVSEEFCSVSGLHQNEIRDAVAEAYVEFWELSKMLTE